MTASGQKVTFDKLALVIRLKGAKEVLDGRRTYLHEVTDWKENPADSSRAMARVGETVNIRHREDRVGATVQH
jgi:hypothetical protein